MQAHRLRVVHGFLAVLLLVVSSLQFFVSTTTSITITTEPGIIVSSNTTTTAVDGYTSLEASTTPKVLEKSTKTKQMETNRATSTFNNNNNSTNDSTEEAFSACLLVMDDNVKLSEWIAYHYYALPLRTLVVLEDPNSRRQNNSSSWEILERWSRYMDITLWNSTSNRDGVSSNNGLADLLLRDDEDRTAVAGSSHLLTTREKTRLHRKRQRRFYAECTKYLLNKKERTNTDRNYNTKKKKLHTVSSSSSSLWTTYIDTDEYFAINPLVVHDAPGRLQTPGHILRLLKETMAKKKERLYHGPCVNLPRVYFAAHEEDDDDKNSNNNAGIPQFVNKTGFDTLRWFHQAPGSFKLNGASKAIMDLSRIPQHRHDNSIVRNTSSFNVHRPIPSCPPNHIRSGPFLLHHYLGSWQQYSSRENDARNGVEHSRARWQERNSFATAGGGSRVIINRVLRPWLQGLVEQMGESEVKRVLQGSAGRIIGD